MTAGRESGRVREVPAPDGPGRAVPAPRATSGTAAGRGVPGQRVPGSGVPERVVPGRGVPERGVPGAADGRGGAEGAGAGAGAGVVREVVRDLRGRPELTPQELLFDAGDIVVVSGLPGSGKTTLMRRTVTDRHIDSQDTRLAWQRRLPHIPYALYRPLTRTAHFVRTWWAMRSGDSLVVHDCGTQAWVRHWLGRGARRRGRALRLVVLDVPAGTALAGQAARGRWVSSYAFARHRGAARRLIAQVEAGRLPTGCASAVLLDRESASVLRRIGFTE